MLFLKFYVIYSTGNLSENYIKYVIDQILKIISDTLKWLVNLR